MAALFCLGRSAQAGVGNINLRIVSIITNPKNNFSSPLQERLQFFSSCLNFFCRGEGGGCLLVVASLFVSGFLCSSGVGMDGQG